MSWVVSENNRPIYGARNETDARLFAGKHGGKVEFVEDVQDWKKSKGGTTSYIIIGGVATVGLAALLIWKLRKPAPVGTSYKPNPQYIGESTNCPAFAQEPPVYPPTFDTIECNECDITANRFQWGC